MRVIEPGHVLELASLDGPMAQVITFVSRVGEMYPGNKKAHPGTNVQEVLRALISRIRYLNWQIACQENDRVIYNLRESILFLEARAAGRHGLTDQFAALVDDSVGLSLEPIEEIKPCSHCGHLVCAVFRA